MKKVWTITWYGLKQLIKDPMYFGAFLGMPLLMTWMMSFLPPQVAGLASSGVIVMFIGVNLINSAGSILDERQNGTWARLLVSPVRRWEIILGLLIKLFLMAWLQALILLLLGKYLFHATWSIALGEVALVLSSYILAMTGLGILLAGLLKTQQQVQIFATGIIMVGSMLGGIFIPVDKNSVIMTTISQLSPQGWAARALNDLMAHGANLSSVAVPLLWMLGLGIGFLILGIWRIRFE